mmetsp:Transcript_22887/g.34356  ORF Transcript_22887/g.34356 Transcript_22887/m.34356 type:complete len:611 (-) Transcript_22887:163-1995(-)|eukprot:CAMPEP_0116043334 /NCGR_PEP_ID=MMETSP0321-20121206/26295_1 /TAXON_ID=163516 /ORGANISM="Leptocylindrus danicus var. danicus, Strain B650" /LENGTH=610 /DNA_ID=CAMNT_0003524125 /DNA_START=14 /DNA_END=1846 /DNA_ORIENTATION=+
MQNFTDTQWEQRGCFVYQLIAEGSVEVRSSLYVGDDNRTGIVFKKNDLMSVDLIRPSRVPGSKNGPFLRLSDNSGWVFEKKYGEIVAKQLPVDKGLWPFYVDNVPGGGASLRCHPTGSRKADNATVYQPMQLIYCDRRVVSPVTNIASYRVQGTNGWIMEKRTDNGNCILIPENKVKVGLFAFEVARGSPNIFVYNAPSVSATTKLPVSFTAGEIVVCDIIRQTPYKHGNGPFLRLYDGWGWMYEQMSDPADGRMIELPIEHGNWSLEAMNSPVGIAMRRHPADRSDCYKDHSTEFKPGVIVHCDRRIKSASGVTFYRVAGKDGWVFDLRGNNRMMKLISSKRCVKGGQVNDSRNGSWSIDFIRGLALALDLEEIEYNQTSRVISFETENNERINIYYTTRTVGTALKHPSQGATQLFRRNVSDELLKEIMQNPRVHTGKGYKKRPRIECYPFGRRTGDFEEGEYIDEEEDYRNRLLEYDREKDEIAAKEGRVLQALKAIDDKRANEAANMKAKIDQRAEEFKKIQREKEEAKMRERRQKEEAELRRRREIAEAEHRARCTCNVCYRVFVNEHAKNQHYQASHVFACDYCGEEFMSWDSLDEHQQWFDHY